MNFNITNYEIYFKYHSNKILDILSVQLHTFVFIIPNHGCHRRIRWYSANIMWIIFLEASLAAKASFLQSVSVTLRVNRYISKYDIFIPHSCSIDHWETVWCEFGRDCMDILRKWDQPDLFHHFSSFCWTGEKETLVNGSGIRCIRMWNVLDIYSVFVWTGTKSY